MPGWKIIYALKGSKTDCEIKVPTVTQARLHLRHRTDQQLDRLVADFGEGMAAEKYCQLHVTPNSMDKLEIHDGTGCILKLV